MSGNRTVWNKEEWEVERSGVGVGRGDRDKERYEPPLRRRLSIESVAKDRSL